MAEARAPVLALGLALLVAAATAATSGQEVAEAEAHVKVQLRGVRDRVEIARDADGELYFYLSTDQGRVERLAPEQFATRVYAEQTRQKWWNRMLNITSPIGIAWVGLGLLGQLLFTGRMLVQWLVSEKAHRSVVPPAFWWMSLAGASMLLIYFVWRRDVIGVLGQGTGWMIYARNLWLIYRSGGGTTPFVDDSETGAALP